MHVVSVPVNFPGTLEGWRMWGRALRNALGPQAAHSSLPKTFYHSFTRETFFWLLSCAKTMLGAGDTGVNGTDVERGRKATGDRMKKTIPDSDTGNEEFN